MGSTEETLTGSGEKGEFIPKSAINRLISIHFLKSTLGEKESEVAYMDNLDKRKRPIK